MRGVSRFVGGVGLAGLLSVAGCASVPPPTVQPAPPLAASVNVLPSVFAAEGRLAVNAAGKGHYGGFVWQHENQWYMVLGAQDLTRTAQAVSTHGVSVTFANDGPIAPELLERMRGLGEIVQTPSGPVGAKASYGFALALVMTKPRDRLAGKRS